MDIKLTSVQVAEELTRIGFPIGKGTVVQWTHKGYIKGTRRDNGGRGGNWTYSLDELTRIKKAAKTYGRKVMPESLVEGYVHVIPAPKTMTVTRKTGTVLTDDIAGKFLLDVHGLLVEIRDALKGREG